MSAFLLVHTQGRWSGSGAARYPADAAALARAGHRVVLFLVQDGVDAALAPAATLTAPLGDGVEVWVDEFSLAQRALTAADLAPGVRPAGMVAVADLLVADGVRVVWR
jgi:predicted peroxiredoxin